MAPAALFSLSRDLARMGFAAAALSSLLAGCGWGQTVTLGAANPSPYRFGAAAPLLELASTARTDNPTLTGDLLEIFFTSDRVSGNGDVWSARRASASVPFQAPAPVVEVNTPMFETSSAISSDGLTLWFGSDRAGGLGLLDVWVSTRVKGGPWSTPVEVPELSSPGDDIPRPPGQHGLVMPFASTRVVLGRYWTYLAARPTPEAPFGAPVLVSDSAAPDRSTVDAFLTDDGLTMFYSSNAFLAPAADAGPSDAAPAVATSDLYVVSRRSIGEAFGSVPPQPLVDLNTAADERDPWLSPDGRTLYFTSDRGGVLNIYAAPVLAR